MPSPKRRAPSKKKARTISRVLNISPRELASLKRLLRKKVGVIEEDIQRSRSSTLANTRAVQKLEQHFRVLSNDTALHYDQADKQMGAVLGSLWDFRKLLTLILDVSRPGRKRSRSSIVGTRAKSRTRAKGSR